MKNKTLGVESGETRARQVLDCFAPVSDHMTENAEACCQADIPAASVFATAASSSAKQVILTEQQPFILSMSTGAHEHEEHVSWVMVVTLHSCTACGCVTGNP